MKIVRNKCYGGFSISLEAARFMAKRGNKIAKAEVKIYDDGVKGKRKLDKLEAQIGVRWFGYGYGGCHDGYSRDDEDLIAAVEELGEKANGECAELEVVEIPDGIEWEIDEYDGLETIHEKHMSW